MGAVPHLKKLHADNKDKGLVIIGVHSKNGGDKMPAFVKDKGIDYAVAHDSEGKTMKAFGGNSYPDYFVIDREGILRFADLANAELEKAVEQLLAEGKDDDEPGSPTKDEKQQEKVVDPKSIGE
ncbi:MAG: peroxiredoxin family protein [Verrucomicrobiales bacterium]